MRNGNLLVVVRVALWAGLISWLGYGIWSGWHRIDELLALRNTGKRVNAQVIGCEQVHAGERMGYVHYAFNEGSRAIDNRLAIPVSMYSEFPIGKAVPVTYLPQDPHIMRFGEVDSGTVERSVVVAAAFLIAGLIAFGLPLIAIGAALNPNRPPITSS